MPTTLRPAGTEANSDNPAEAVTQFDRLFRRQLVNLYRLLGLEPPPTLAHPLPTGGDRAASGPAGGSPAGGSPAGGSPAGGTGPHGERRVEHGGVMRRATANSN